MRAWVVCLVASCGRIDFDVHDATGYAGIYGVNMNRSPMNIFSATGFRCVYRPL